MSSVRSHRRQPVPGHGSRCYSPVALKRIFATFKLQDTVDQHQFIWELEKIAGEFRRASEGENERVDPPSIAARKWRARAKQLEKINKMLGGLSKAEKESLREAPETLAEMLNRLVRIEEKIEAAVPPAPEDEPPQPPGVIDQVSNSIGRLREAMLRAARPTPKKNHSVPSHRLIHDLAVLYRRSALNPRNLSPHSKDPEGLNFLLACYRPLHGKPMTIDALHSTYRRAKKGAGETLVEILSRLQALEAGVASLL
jgi:hypothetical protein